MAKKWAKFPFLLLQRGLRGSTHKCKKVRCPKLHNMSHLDEVFINKKMLFSHDLAGKLARMTLKMGKIPIFTASEGSEGFNP